METDVCYDNYPLKNRIITPLFSGMVFLLGILIFYMISTYWVLFYVLIMFISSIAIMYFRCRSCYYYGKNCGGGSSKITKLLFKRTNENLISKNFRKVQYLSALVLYLPIIGLILIILNISRDMGLILFIMYSILLIISQYATKNYACKYCKQGRMGCEIYNKLYKLESKK